MAYGEQRYTVVSANNRATVTITTTGRQTWIVSQVSLEMPNADVGGLCVLRKNGAFITSCVATGDVAGGDPPILLRNGDRMTVEWTAISNSLLGQVLVIYDDGAPS